MAPFRKTVTLCERDTRQLWGTNLIHPLARDVKNTLLTRKRQLTADSDSNSLLGVLLYPHSQSGRYTGIPLSVRPSVRPSLNLMYVTSLLLDFIHIWYLGWPWSEHAHIIPISRMVDFCKSYSPFHVCLTIRPFAHLVYATSHLYFVAFHSYLVFWLAMIWACAYYTDFTDGWFLQEL
jgi:hypothetical protein